MHDPAPFDPEQSKARPALWIALAVSVFVYLYTRNPFFAVVLVVLLALTYAGWKLRAPK